MTHFHHSRIDLVRFGVWRRGVSFVALVAMLAVWSLVGVGCQNQDGMMICGTIAGIGCPDGMYCAFDEGRCNVADDAGVCSAIPEVCIELFAPVCGCDGLTYSNACMAASASVSLASQRECLAP